MHLVCTMVISGLTHHPLLTGTHPHTHTLREPLLSQARLGQSIAAHSAGGTELHLIQLLCHHLFTVHTHTPPLTACIRKDGTNGEAAGMCEGWGAGGRVRGDDEGSEPRNRSQSIPPSSSSS